MILEVCCDSVESVRAAIEGGAQRVELCRELATGGLTPPDEMVQYAVENGIRTHVLIRSRDGNFVYTPAEVAEMVSEITRMRQMGVHGVVVGALTAAGDIDMGAYRQMTAAAEGMSITFHRAFDECRNPQQALEDIIALGCQRLLTSGQATSAEKGIPLLHQLVQQAGGRIIIMPGAGVSPENVQRILHETGAMEIHGSLRTDGQTDVAKVRRVMELLT